MPGHQVDEFGLIRELFVPIAKSSEYSLALADDGGFVPPAPEGAEQVITADAIVENVHFLARDPAWSVAAKLVGVNLSDLASMGAVPVGVVVTAQFGKTADMAYIQDFATGLQNALATDTVALLGGDTVRHNGPNVFSLTAIGHVAKGAAMHRFNAKAGELLCVTGTLGDAALGLRCAKGEKVAGLGSADAAFLAARYRVPNPRVGFGAAIAGHVRCCMDISDGLCADLAHVCKASGVCATLHTQDLPLSDAFMAALAADESVLGKALGGGDDYELLMTVDSTKLGIVRKLAEEHSTSLTVIGEIAEAQEGRPAVTVLDAKGQPVPLDKTGYNHF